METVYTFVKGSVASNGSRCIIYLNSKMVLDYMEKLKELTGKIIHKNSAPMEKPLGILPKTNNNEADIEKSKFLNHEFCEVKVVSDAAETEPCKK